MHPALFVPVFLGLSFVYVPRFVVSVKTSSLVTLGGGGGAVRIHFLTLGQQV